MSNRSVSTDALETLGTIIDDTQKRDAIHLAVLPAVAGERLKPGENIHLVNGKALSCSDPGDVSLGIVDPFLTAPVKKGERFWMVLRPRLVTSLRHVWSHPAFPDEADEVLVRSKAASEAWLRNFCEKADCPPYEKVLATVLGEDVADEDGWGAGITDNYLHFGGIGARGEIPPEFWDHMEVVTGKKMTERPDFFSCSC